MEEKLRKYVEALFADAPKTKQTVELRQEIYTNLMDKYHDLVEKGASPEEAFEIVKGSVGNVDELIGGLYERPEENPVAKQKAATLNAVATALYIASPVFIIAFSVSGMWLVGLVLLLVCIALATGVKVYANAMYKPAYQKVDDSMVEEFKEWKAENGQKVEKKNIYSGVLWPLIVAAYLLISFATHAWYITWVIFIIGAAIEQLIKLRMNR